MTENYKILLDVPLGGSDMNASLALGHNGLANAFQQVIEHSDPQFAIGIFGGWGSGKTTLMRAIEMRLSTQNCATVWFSAWRYEKEDHLIVPLLDVIREGLVKWVEENQTESAALKKSTLKVAGSIGKAIDILLRGFSVKAKIPGVFDLNYDANKALDRAEEVQSAVESARTPRSFYHASFRAMQEAFEEFTANGARRIVVFVDDLDRCLPEGALEVLESMKLFFDLKGFVFVVGVDRRIVELSVEKRYREMLPPSTDGIAQPEGVSGARYLRKIFQVPYGLAPVSAAQIGEFLWSVQQHADLPPDQATEIEEVCRPHLSYLVEDGGVNPREIKRYLNSFTLVRKISPWLDPGVVLSLQTIAFRLDWAEIQLAFLAFRDVFLDALKREVDEPGVGHLGTVWPALEAPPASFLTYVGQGGPGNALYQHASNGMTIDDYIFSGEATRSSEGSSFVFVFRALGEAMLHVRGAAENNKDTKEIVNHLSQAMSQLMSVSESGGGQYEGARRDLETLMKAVEGAVWDREPPDDVVNDVTKELGLDSRIGEGRSPEELRATSRGRDWLQGNEQYRRDLADQWTQSLRTIIANLQEFYRAGLT